MNVRYLPGLIVLLLVTACGSGEAKPIKREEKPKVEAKQWHDVVGEYKTFIKTLPKGNVNNATRAMKKFKELFRTADKLTCDSGFVVFHELYQQLNEEINNDVYGDDVLQNTFWNQTDENGKTEPMPKAFQDLEKKVKPNGYRLEFPEGMISVGYDRKFIAKHFYRFVSPTMRKYLKQLDKENELGFSEDAGILISEEDYVDRLIWWERFEQSYPDFLCKKEVRDLRVMYFTFFVYGMDNTPVYWPIENEPIQISDYFLNAYAYLESKYPKSSTWKLIKPYKTALLANDKAEAEKVMKSYSRKGLFLEITKR